MNSEGRQIDIFEFSSNLGLREQRGKEPKVKFFPQHLKKHGFYDIIKPSKIVSLSPPEYSMNFDEDSGILNVDKMLDYALKQAEIMENELNNPNFKLVIGGDCSILLGNAVALKNHGKYGLFFLDGHTDYSHIDITGNKAPAGMDLGLATGLGTSKLTNINNSAPYFQEEDVYCVGDKEKDPDYVELISNSKINYYDLEQLRGTGMENVAHSFLSHVAESELDGFFVHFDVDVLSDDIMPAVDSRGKKGLNYSETLSLLNILIAEKNCIGLEITIFDPSLDEDGTIVKELINNLLAHLNTLLTPKK